MRLVTLLAPLALAACGNKDDTTGIEPPPPEPTGDTGPTTTPEPPPGPDMIVLAANDYLLTTTWTIASTSVRAQQDALVSWSAVFVDAWGETIGPSAVPTLAMFEITLPPDEIPARLAADDLGSDLISTWQADVNGLVFQNLDDLANGKTPFLSSALMVQTNNKAWMLSLAVPDGNRLDLRTALLVTPEDGYSTVDITMSEADSTFTWSAALTGEVLRTSAGLGVYTVDWSDLGTDAFGKPYDEERGDVLFIGRFDEAPNTLGAQALDLASVAEGWWTMDVSSDDSARLDLARDGGGSTFGGFTTGSTWVVGVECSTCLSPFPLWMSVVEVE